MNKIIEKMKYQLLSKIDKYNKKIRKISRKIIGLFCKKYIPLDRAARILGDKTRCYSFIRHEVMWKNITPAAGLDYELTQEDFYKLLLTTSIYVYTEPDFSLKNELVNQGINANIDILSDKAFVKREDLYELIDKLSIQKYY
jgi:hypothetical protein